MKAPNNPPDFIRPKTGENVSGVVDQEDMMTILSAIALVLGGLIAFFNWYSIYASRKSGRFVSAVPIIGCALLVFGFFGFRLTRPYAWLGIILD